MYMRAIYLVLLIVSVAGWVMIEFRRRLGPMLRAALAWGLIFLGGIAAYGMWGDVSRSLSPPQMEVKGKEIELTRAADGHFYLALEINGQPIRFMVDTGASNITLSLTDAEKLGLELGDLDFLSQAQTANGVVRTARVKLAQVRLGEAISENVTAYVNEGAMETSLLGMSYLRDYSIRIEGSRMILAP